MSEPEYRHDATTDRWVIIAPDRAKRPKDRKNLSSCPFCPGNENLTPPAWLVYSRSENGELVKTFDKEDGRVEKWIIRCFKNMFPALKSDLPFEEKLGEALFFATTSYSGFGYHEVIVESPDHRAHPHNNSIRGLELVVEAYFEVMTKLSYERGIKYVCLFRNYKPEAGASISHPHSQVIALPVVPSTVKREVDVARRYNRERGGCIYCDLIELEICSPRLIYADEHYVVVAPWASVLPYEFWIIPRRHEPSFLNTYPKERRALSRALKATLLALKKVLNDPPYNYGFHVAPLRWKGESYHWHIEVHPRVMVPGGFELTSGMYINTVPPERAASELRTVVEKLGF
ncbi:MAG: galactose-1-phosphate uridylyltransferase [Candidatus Nezhaarchaeales archaeon]